MWKWLWPRRRSTQTLLLRPLILSLFSKESGISAFPEEDNIFCWKGTIAGSKDTVFQGIVYKMSFSFPNDYPFKPPKVKFETGCFHPNVDVWKYLLRHSSEMLRQVLVTTGFGSKQGAMRRETHNELQKHLSTEGHPYHKFSTDWGRAHGLHNCAT